MPHPELELGDADCIHTPIVRAVCRNQDLEPGDWVRFVSTTMVEPCDRLDAHGIVWPFLDDDVGADDEFNVLVNPKFIGPIRHNFALNLQVPYDPDGIGCGVSCG